MLQIRLFPTHTNTIWTICRFMAESYSVSKWMNWQTKGSIEQSLPLYSKLALTCAYAAFMAPPWIWCKDHSVRCCIITKPWLDLRYCRLPCNHFTSYQLKYSKCLTELSPLCNGNLVLDSLAEANGPLSLDLHGRYCASFFVAHLILQSFIHGTLVTPLD